MGVRSVAAGLDPILMFASGNAGGTEVGLIYDRLVEWNPTTKKVRHAHRRVGDAERRLHSGP
jgi:hypothetical protein